MDDHDPYRAPVAALAVAPAAQALADPWMRLAAALIDGMLALLLLLPMMYFGGYFDGVLQGVEPGLAEQAAWGVVGLVVFVAVQGIPLHADGQTWGKKLLGMKIVDLDGNKPPLGRLVGLRYLPSHAIAMIPGVGLLYTLVDSLFIFGDERRCLHDRIAGTRVVTVGRTDPPAARVE